MELECVQKQGITEGLVAQSEEDLERERVGEASLEAGGWDQRLCCGPGNRLYWLALGLVSDVISCQKSQ